MRAVVNRVRAPVCSRRRDADSTDVLTWYTGWPAVLATAALNL